MSCDEGSEFSDDTVDPRVQVELERLNVATDDINRLEVDLDESRSYFRQLLMESTSRIDACSKKLGHCIIKARPYYDARLKAKEALKETQKIAAKFERANSAHAAAKEMVFLAEEGLKAEGRTFDHAWQEMLNHATMRVNESEAERTLCEAEHKRSSQLYQLAEIRVQTLQRSLKRAISKSRPYFELKIHYNQLLEEQKNKVRSLERQVTETKLGYAQTLKHLEQISDEIHQSRHQRLKKQCKTGEDSNSHSNTELPNSLSNKKGEDNRRSLNLSETACELQSIPLKATPTSASSIPDTDIWSETSEQLPSEDFTDRDSAASDNDSSLTGMADSESDDLSESGPMPQRADFSMESSSHSPFDEIASEKDKRKTEEPRQHLEGVGICSFPLETKLSTLFVDPKTNDKTQWSEIELNTSTTFDTVHTVPRGSEEDFDIPYAILSDFENEQAGNATPSESSTGNSELSGDKSCASVTEERKEEGLATCLPSTPKKIMNMRRQSLDVLWNTATGEKMKEILSQSIMKLNIGPLSERRSSESKVNTDSLETDVVEAGSSYDSNLSSQFGLQFFSKKSKIEEEQQSETKAETSDTGKKKDRFFAKKVPSPLERTLSFLNADEDSASDTDSLPSVDLLTDEQLSALVLDQDLLELYQDIL